MSSQKFVKSVAKSASNLKATDIKILDLADLCSFTDYFMICSGSSSRHVQSIADNIVIEQKKNGHQPLGVEGESKGDWVLIDFGSVVAHVFYPETREFYNIERLWGDAKRVKIKGITE